jgi:hypothetical protein
MVRRRRNNTVPAICGKASLCVCKISLHFVSLIGSVCDPHSREYHWLWSLKFLSNVLILFIFIAVWFMQWYAHHLLSRQRSNLCFTQPVPAFILCPRKRDVVFGRACPQCVILTPPTYKTPVWMEFLVSSYCHIFSLVSSELFVSAAIPFVCPIFCPVLSASNQYLFLLKFSLSLCSPRTIQSGPNIFSKN